MRQYYWVKLVEENYKNVSIYRKGVQIQWQNNCTRFIISKEDFISNGGSKKFQILGVLDNWLIERIEKNSNLYKNLTEKLIFEGKLSAARFGISTGFHPSPVLKIGDDLLLQIHTTDVGLAIKDARFNKLHGIYESVYEKISYAPNITLFTNKRLTTKFDIHPLFGINNFIYDLTNNFKYNHIKIDSSGKETFKTYLANPYELLDDNSISGGMVRELAQREIDLSELLQNEIKDITPTQNKTIVKKFSSWYAGDTQMYVELAHPHNKNIVITYDGSSSQLGSELFGKNLLIEKFTI